MLGASKLETFFKDEQATSERFRERLLHLENETQQRSATIGELSRREKELEERCREQVSGDNLRRIRSLTVLGRNGSYSSTEAK